MNQVGAEIDDTEDNGEDQDATNKDGRPHLNVAAEIDLVAEVFQRERNGQRGDGGDHALEVDEPARV